MSDTQHSTVLCAEQQQGNSDRSFHEQETSVMSVALCVQRSGCVGPAYNMTTQSLQPVMTHKQAEISGAVELQSPWP